MSNRLACLNAQEKSTNLSKELRPVSGQWRKNDTYTRNLQDPLAL
jgi:hypothetical protein